MHVDQRQVTAISLKDGRDRDCILFHEGGGYRLSFVSQADVVNVYLSKGDLDKLRMEIAGRDGRAIRRDAAHGFESISGWNVHPPGVEEMSSKPISLENAHFAWTSADWLAYN